MINDLEFMKFVINYYTNMPALLKRIGIDVAINGQMFCPFHDNYNTPAAKLYKDSRGYSIFCFSEHKIYSSYDLMKDILKYNIRFVFDSIWNSISDLDKKFLQDNFGELDTEEIQVPCIEELDKFRRGSISYKELCDILGKVY